MFQAWLFSDTFNCHDLKGFIEKTFLRSIFDRWAFQCGPPDLRFKVHHLVVPCHKSVVLNQCPFLAENACKATTDVDLSHMLNAEEGQTFLYLLNYLYKHSLDINLADENLTELLEMAVIFGVDLLVAHIVDLEPKYQLADLASND